MSRTFSSACWWFTAGLFSVLLLPALAHDGLFMDGMLYTVVAFNLAHGQGSFWEPVFSPLGLAGLPTFHEHPPLGFGIQALWFKLWGDAFWVERLWSLLTAVLNAAIIIGIWRTLSTQYRELRALAWWPVLLWIIIPVNFWSYQNNMHENSMGLFSGLALWALVAGGLGRMPWNAACALAGLAVFLATFIKGLPESFPLATPFIVQLFTRRPGWRSAITGTLVALLVCSAAYALLLLSGDARQSLGTYVNERLLRRIAEKPTVDSHFWIVPRLLNELLPTLILVGLAVGAGRKRIAGTPDGHMRWGLALVAIGLSGVLPLMLTRVQKAFYFTPALAALALGLALVSAPAMANLLGRLSTRGIRALRAMGMLLVASALLLAVRGWGKPGRDADMLHDMALIGSQVPEHEVIGAQPELWEEWNLQGYLLRYHRIGIDPAGTGREWYLAQQGVAPPRGHIAVDLPLKAYILSRRMTGAGE